MNLHYLVRDRQGAKCRVPGCGYRISQPALLNPDWTLSPIMINQLRICLLSLSTLASGLMTRQAARAQESPLPIADNSFLIEEAYNQEAGVVQHISTYSRSASNRSDASFLFTFTQEWPIWKQAHQLSYVIPLQRIEAFGGTRTGIGDIAINYRNQLVNTATLALAPRLTVILPTGKEQDALGAGTTGFQATLPLSVYLARTVVAHSNAGITYTPSARNTAGDEANTTAYNLGQSLIWLVRPRLNLMIEMSWNSAQDVIAPDRTDRSESLFISPGVRVAFNFRSGLQIVPGIAVPIGVGPSDGEKLVFAYLSFEHGF